MPGALPDLVPRPCRHQRVVPAARPITASDRLAELVGLRLRGETPSR
jgi:hypothetical protein